MLPIAPQLFKFFGAICCVAEIMENEMIPVKVTGHCCFPSGFVDFMLAVCPSQVLLTGNVEDCAIGTLTLLPALLARFCE